MDLSDYQLSRLAAALWGRVGQETTFHDLAWADDLLGEGGRQLLWSELQTEGVIVNCDVRAKPLASFLGRQGSTEQAQLLWTLPPGLQGPPASYAEGLITVIGSARHELLLMSPFIASSGIQTMKQHLLDALHRGVQVTIIGHQLHDLGSAQSQAIESLRQEAERSQQHFSAYSANHQSGLLHAKLVIADRERVVLGSANMTGHGLNLNFEVGVTLGNPQAKQVAQIYDQLLRSDLVQHVFTTWKETQPPKP